MTMMSVTQPKQTNTFSQITKVISNLHRRLKLAQTISIVNCLIKSFDKKTL